MMIFKEKTWIIITAIVVVLLIALGVWYWQQIQHDHYVSEPLGEHLTPPRPYRPRPGENCYQENGYCVSEPVIVK